MRQYDARITYDDTIVIYALIILGQALVMTIGGKIELRTGPRMAAALGSLMLIGSTLAASWITSLWAMALVYGLCFGFGGGITYTIPLACGFRWDSHQKGWISGVVLSGERVRTGGRARFAEKHDSHTSICIALPKHTLSCTPIRPGFGASALIFNQVQSAIVNPHNLKPEVVYSE